MQLTYAKLLHIWRQGWRLGCSAILESSTPTLNPLQHTLNELTFTSWQTTCRARNMYLATGDVCVCGLLCVCVCDWLRFHIPCKHFFAMFQPRANRQWEQLPQSYLHSTYLSADSDALAKHFDFDTFSTAGGIILQHKKRSQMLRLIYHHS